MLRFFCLFGLLTLSTMNSWAWWNEPHQVIAAIAYRHLTPDVRKQVDQLAAVFQKHEGVEYDYYFMAIWPDKLNAQGVTTFWPWHGAERPYLKLEQGFSEDKEKTCQSNGIFAVNYLQTILKNQQVPEYERARALSFLIHIVGDLHQPMHAINLFDSTNPDGDQGGHFFKVAFKTIHKHQVKNLHQLWDSVLGEFDHYEASREQLEKNADYIEAKFPDETLKKQSEDLVVTHWVDESFNLAKQYVYQIEREQAPSKEYIEANKPRAEKRMALAAYRLAHVLNVLLVS